MIKHCLHHRASLSGLVQEKPLIEKRRNFQKQHRQGNPLPGTDGYATNAEHTQKLQHKEYNYVYIVFSVGRSC